MDLESMSPPRPAPPQHSLMHGIKYQSDRTLRPRHLSQAIGVSLLPICYQIFRNFLNPSSGRRSIEAEASAARRRRAARVPERANKATSQLIDQYEEEVVGGGFSVPVY
ncbi:hypothetical protein LI328DRAFT_131898 [Trichoderma asperelloides]|nr:hypothetical protein LI328DRAFT_131898 [Trichoderma asperelloides]